VPRTSPTGTVATAGQRMVRLDYEDEGRRLELEDGEGGGPAIEEVRDRPALQWKVVVACECDHRCEVDAALEPGLDLVDAAALHLDPVVTVDGRSGECVLRGSP
jgi:hypothetical protein